jgi:hypothetical protein
MVVLTKLNVVIDVGEFTDKLDILLSLSSFFLGGGVIAGSL